MKTGIRYVLFGLFAFLVCLVFTVPADFCYALLKKRVRLPVQFDLYGIEGSWRAGRAAQIVVNGRRFTDFTWTLDFFPLLVGQKSGHFSLRQERGTVACDFAADQDRITLTSVLAQMPAEALQAYLPDYGFKLSGELKAVFASMQFGKGALQAASGAVVWRGAALLSSQRLLLGDIKAQFVPEANGIQVKLSDGGGPLLVDGQILLKPDRSYSLTGAFAVRDRKQQFLHDTLQLFGKPGSDGRISLVYSGRLPLLFP